MVKPVLFYALFNPSARAVLLTIRLLDLDVELRISDYARKDNVTEEFVNNRHTIPYLIDDGEVLYDSHAIITYLVSKYGHDDSLYPKELVRRAKVDQKLHFDSAVLSPVIRHLVNGIIYDGAVEFSDESLRLTHIAYDLTESFLAGDFLVGSHVTVADISCVSTINTIQRLVSIDQDRYPRLAIWLDRMGELPGYHEVNDEGCKMLAIRLEKYILLNIRNGGRVEVYPKYGQ